MRVDWRSVMNRIADLDRLYLRADALSAEYHRAGDESTRRKANRAWAAYRRRVAVNDIPKSWRKPKEITR